MYYTITVKMENAHQRNMKGLSHKGIPLCIVYYDIMAQLLEKRTTD